MGNSYFDLREPPKREQRLKPCIAFGGKLCTAAGQKRCMQGGADRSFTQGSICLLLPALGMLNSLPNSVVLLHGAVGCGSSIHGGTIGVRSGSTVRGEQTRDVLWLSTAMSEADVIGGGEVKLRRAIEQIDQQYHPGFIIVVSACVPGITGDDVDGVISNLQTKINATILSVHCEGFKTKIWATAYDAVYHAIGRVLLPDPQEKPARDAWSDRTVNLMNVSSMGRVDEVELERLLKGLGLRVNVFPVFSDPVGMRRMAHAALSISTCPTHDDYILGHLKEKYGVPYLLEHMPIGIDNTTRWIRDVAAFFKVQEHAERMIERETTELQKALEPLRPLLKGKKVLVSAGEFRALAAAAQLDELGLEVVAIRAYHHDEFAEPEYQKLLARLQKDTTINIANCQPYEEANLIRRLKPDVFLGHLNGNGTAAKMGVATHPIYNTGLHYVGYRGVFELARRLHRQLSNPRFNQILARHARLPYREQWYEQDPFRFIKTPELVHE